MGCDIHMYVEYRSTQDGEWQPIEEHTSKSEGWIREVTATGRCYAIFAELACVRGSGMYLPRGLPNDVSPKVGAAASRWGVDAHSHSHLSLEEFEKVIKKCKKHIDLSSKDDRAFYNFNDPHQPPCWISVLNFCKKLKQTKELDNVIFDEKILNVDVRLVFWFDS